ncbi:MAG: class I SAM-dependent methyltransferase [Deltaproteobacteria bacterium]|nr:class I SAM-dependent methyltransferase [Deltaproteobacteria bacterium]
MNQTKRTGLLEYTRRYKEILHRSILEHVKNRSPCSVLDIGCRWGKDLQRVAVMNADIDIFGVDICSDAIKVASKKFEKNQNVHLYQAKGEVLPFKDNYFDIIFSSEVIEHIDQVEQFIKEVHRVLKNQGAFIITTPSKFNYTHLIGKLVPSPFKKSLRKLVYYINPGDPDVNPHVREYTPGQLRQLFEQNGFRVGRIIGGTLRVPVWPLFERFGFLLLIWKCFDRFIDFLPWGIHLKHNFVMEAMKLPKK